MHTPLLMAIGVAGLLALCILDRRRFARRLQSLSEQQRESETVLSAFMEESEKITFQLTRLISARRETEFLQPKNNGVEKRHLVLGLARRGRSVSQIAERLMLPAGEVELILNLNRTTRGVKTA